ncbi:peptidylprolyl isomerase [Chitinibacteraceae bacterium HSL-7]
MKRTLTTFALALTLAHSVPAVAAISTVDRVVAVVNSGVITEYELEQRVASISRGLKGKTSELPPADVLRQQVLERMIMEEIQLQYAQSAGIRIDDNQLERALARIADQNKASLAQMRQKVEADGNSWNEFRENIRDEMTQSRLREREVDAKIQVSDAEIDDYIKLNGAQSNEEFELSQIVVNIPENASPEQIQQRRARIQAARQELADGKAFANVAATYSDGREATIGGSVGWRAAGSLPPQFVDMLKNMQNGQITEIIRSPAGFHMFRLDNRRTEARREVVQQTEVSHILIKVNELNSESDAIRKLQQVRDRIAQGATFEDMAKAYSEDVSASTGGSLGWINPGETVPEFERAMNGLKVGQVSDIIRSPFGVHLIKVDARRQQDVTELRERMMVRDAIRQRKAEETFEDWLRQSRDRAYVVIKLKDE